MKLENQVLAWRTYEVGKPGPSLGQTQIGQPLLLLCDELVNNMLQKQL